MQGEESKKALDEPLITKNPEVSGTQRVKGSKSASASARSLAH